MPAPAFTFRMPPPCYSAEPFYGFLLVPADPPPRASTNESLFESSVSEDALSEIPACSPRVTSATSSPRVSTLDVIEPSQSEYALERLQERFEREFVPALTHVWEKAIQTRFEGGYSMKLDIGKYKSSTDWEGLYLSVANLDNEIDDDDVMMTYIPLDRNGAPNGYAVLAFPSEEQAARYLDRLRDVCPAYADRAEEYCPRQAQKQRVGIDFFIEASRRRENHRKNAQQAIAKFWTKIADGWVQLVEPESLL